MSATYQVSRKVRKGSYYRNIMAIIRQLVRVDPMFYDYDTIYRDRITEARIRYYIVVLLLM